MSDIKWTNDKVRLGDLIEWEQNPRFSTKAQAERIADSHRMFGQPEPMAIDPDNKLLNGHQRLSSWLSEYGPDYEVDVRRASRLLTDEERQALTAMLHAGAVGSWDWDVLANWDADILQGFGFDEELLKSWQTDTFALGDLLVANLDFLPFSGEGDGGGSQVSTGDKVRVVIGPKIFDLKDSTHKIYQKIKDIDEDRLKNATIEMIENL